MSPSVDELVGAFVESTRGCVLVSCDSYGGPPLADHVDVGIREMTAVSVAAGLASQGLRPVVLGLAPFLLSRAFGQIRQDVVLNDLPVTIVGKASGRALEQMGPTHQLPNDLHLLRALAPLRVALASEPAELSATLAGAHRRGRPLYVRVAELVDADRLARARAGSAPGADEPELSGGGSVLVATGPDLLLAHAAAARVGHTTRVLAVGDLDHGELAGLRTFTGQVVVLEREAPGLTELVRDLLTDAAVVVTWRPRTTEEADPPDEVLVDQLVRFVSTSAPVPHAQEKTRDHL